MARDYISIFVQCPSRDIVGRTLSDGLGAQLVDHTLLIGEVLLEVEDVGAAAAFTEQYMIDNGLEDVNPVWKRFRLSDFPVHISVSAPPDSPLWPIREHIADSIASWLTVKLNARTIVNAGNGEVPIAVHDPLESDDYFRTPQMTARKK